jgi:hypothetical protein
MYKQAKRTRETSLFRPRPNRVPDDQEVENDLQRIGEKTSLTRYPPNSFLGWIESQK